MVNLKDLLFYLSVNKENIYIFYFISLKSALRINLRAGDEEACIRFRSVKFVLHVSLCLLYWGSGISMYQKMRFYTTSR